MSILAVNIFNIDYFIIEDFYDIWYDKGVVDKNVFSRVKDKEYIAERIEMIDQETIRIETTPILRTYVSKMYQLVAAEIIEDYENWKYFILQKDLLTGIHLESARRSKMRMETILCGDRGFKHSRMKIFDFDQIKEAFFEALQLDLCNIQKVTRYCEKYGLPLSDCTEHIKNYVDENCFEGMISNVEMSILDNAMDFIDGQPYIKIIYSFKILQAMATLKSHIDQIGTMREACTDTDILNLFIDIVHILLTFNLNFFAHVNNVGEIRYNTETALFITDVIEDTDFTDKELTIEQLLERIISMKSPDGEKIYLKAYLNTEHVACLMKIINAAVNIAKRKKKDVISLFFGNEDSINYVDLEMEYMTFNEIEVNSWQRHVLRENIIEAGRRLFYDLLSEINFETYHLAEVLNNNEVRYSVHLPSLIHGLFYVMYTKNEGVLKTCERCGKTFSAQSKREDARYCSDTCSAYVRNKKHREKLKKLKVKS